MPKKDNTDEPIRLKRIKPMQMTFAGAAPMGLQPVADQSELVQPTKYQQKVLRTVAKAIREYRNAAASLLEGKYKHLSSIAPRHLVDQGNILVVICGNSIVVRYEVKGNDASRKIFGGFFPTDLTHGALLLSQNVIFCHPVGQLGNAPADLGIDLKLYAGNPTKGTETQIVSTKLWFDVAMQAALEAPTPPQKPLCVCSVRNYLEFQVHGELVPQGASPGVREKFIARSRLRMGVGWECIEVFPEIELASWKPEYARIWAENDILATALTHQLEETAWQSLDHRAATRRQYAELLEAFKKLLDSAPDREELLQQFLAAHPELLCPAHTRVWPKLPFGAHVTDFVFREATDDYLLVELERSTHRLFRKDGHITAALNHAQGQIVDWKRYLEDNLGTVQRELELVGISANPRSLVVIGRASALFDGDRRKLAALNSQQPRTKIVTYDDVYENAKTVVQNLLGPIDAAAGTTNIYYLGKVGSIDAAS